MLPTIEGTGRFQAAVGARARFADMWEILLNGVAEYGFWPGPITYVP
jgi:hypothetical protein